MRSCATAGPVPATHRPPVNIQPTRVLGQDSLAARLPPEESTRTHGRCLVGLRCPGQDGVPPGRSAPKHVQFPGNHSPSTRHNAARNPMYQSDTSQHNRARMVVAPLQGGLTIHGKGARPTLSSDTTLSRHTNTPRHSNAMAQVSQHPEGARLAASPASGIITDSSLTPHLANGGRPWARGRPTP